MSPEQADLSNQDIDTRTDVYSLGIVLYELLAGVLPFDPKILRAGGIDHIRKVICEEDPKTPSTRLSRTSVEESTESARRRRTDIRTLRRKLCGDLDWITLKALEKDRTRRYATVDALAADIRNYLNHQPVSAAPPSVLYRTRKSLRRHRTAVSAAGAALLLLIVAGWAIHLSLRAGRLAHERMLAQAKELVAEGQFSEANATVAPLLSSIHVRRRAQLLRAKILLGQEDLEAAVSQLEKLVDTPDEVAGQAHLLLASIYYEGDPRAPGPADQYYQRYEHHRQEAEKLIAGTADYYFLQAQGTYDIQEMLHLLNKALELDTQHYEALQQRACIYRAQKDYILFLMDAHTMTVVRPNSAQGHNLNAIALREIGLYREALKEHQRAIDLSPEQAWFHDERSRTYARMGQYETGLGDARTCMNLEPNNPSYLHRLFATYTALGQYDEAEQVYRSLSAASYQQPGIPDAEPRLWFFALSFKLVFDSCDLGQAWHGPTPPPSRAPFGAMYYADECFTQLSRKARRVISHGFHPSWSPDGRRLVYAQGTGMGSALVMLDLDTRRRELLVAPGREPQWSPDGRYIAFVKTQRLLPLTRLGALNLRDLWTVGEAPPQPSEVWVIDLNTRAVRCIAKGEHPHWGESGLLYYSQDRTLYAISPGQEDEPEVIVSDSFGAHPLVSPNEQYVAEARYPELRIIQLAGNHKLVANWTIPPQLALWTTSLQWSPDSRTVNVGNFMASDMGLWIYDLGTHAALGILDGPIAAAPRSPDGQRLAICLSAPYFEIWIAEVDPNRPTAQALGATRTVEEHCREVMDIYDRRIETDPNLLFNHLQRTAFALWIDDDRADGYLREMEGVLRRVSYPAAEYNTYARAVLSNLSPTQGQLLPLAILLAGEAVKMQPAQAQLFAWMFRRAGYPQQASDLLQEYPDAPRGSSRYDRATGGVSPAGPFLDSSDIPSP